MKFICDECTQETPHFRGLLDHYKEKHPGLLKRYEIRHALSGVILLAYAPNANILINNHKWHKNDCKVKEVK